MILRVSLVLPAAAQPFLHAVRVDGVELTDDWVPAPRSYSSRATSSNGFKSNHGAAKSFDGTTSTYAQTNLNGVLTVAFDPPLTCVHTFEF